ncbi:STAS domain-containing protein [Lentzea aerocolonigenes]|uniref:STAS domain-containing protein n=1 Tax=Lentzea aerocolonigenes TaxID=68170 RepID=UPI000696535C|nr:STAS domain-containing protein [Lentzea aerocolonigenes]
MQEPLPLEMTAERTGVSIVVRVAGEIDLATAPAFEEFLLDQLAHTRAVLMVDLAEVDHIGSAGLGVLLAVRAECDRRRVDLVFGECSFIVSRVFELSGLASHFLGGGAGVSRPAAP